MPGKDNEIMAARDNVSIFFFLSQSMTPQIIKD